MLEPTAQGDSTMTIARKPALLALALGLAAANAFAADSQATLQAEAKITEAQARATALARVPLGTVKSAELEREHGRLVWSFDIAQPSVKGVTEILVDARTGKIASLKKESPAEEAKEAKADAATAK
jgi:uncharacterized membrane protein YkoI